MMKKILLITTVLVLALIVVAFATQSEKPKDGDPGNEIPEKVQDIVDRIADRHNLNAEQIRLISAEEVEWPSACLGLAGEDEMCAEVITPGWKIVLSVADEEFTFHTDLNGEYIRQK